MAYAPVNTSASASWGTNPDRMTKSPTPGGSAPIAPVSQNITQNWTPPAAPPPSPVTSNITQNWASNPDRAKVNSPASTVSPLAQTQPQQVSGAGGTSTQSTTTATAKPPAPVSTSVNKTQTQKQDDWNQQQVDDFTAYIDQVKSGNDPITEATLSRMLKIQNASGQASMDRYMQELARTGQAGTGAGNAMLQLMARDMNTSVVDLTSRMSADAVARVERFNELGFQTAQALDNKEYMRAQTELNRMLEMGMYDQASQLSQQMSDRFGVTTPDFNDPQNVAKFESEFRRANTIRNDLESRYASGAISYDKFVEEWEKQFASDPAFAKYSGRAPSKTQAAMARETAWTAQATQNLYNNAAIMVANGNSDGAASLIGQQFNEDGLFYGTGLNAQEMSEKFLQSTEPAQAALSEFNEMFSQFVSNNETDAAYSLAKMISESYPDDPFVQSFYSGMLDENSDVWKSVLQASDLQSQVVRNESASVAGDIVGTYWDSIGSMTPEMESEFAGQWKENYQKSLTDSELRRRASESLNIGAVTDQDIDDYLDNMWEMQKNMSDPVSVVKTMTKNATALLQESMGLGELNKEQEQAINSYLSQYFSPILAGEDVTMPTWETFMDNPDNFLAFRSFTGDDLSQLSQTERQSFDLEKQVYSAFRNAGGSIDPEKFHDYYIEARMQNPNLTTQQIGAQIADNVGAADAAIFAAEVSGIPERTLLSIAAGNTEAANSLELSQWADIVEGSPEFITELRQAGHIEDLRNLPIDLSTAGTTAMNTLTREQYVQMAESNSVFVDNGVIYKRVEIPLPNNDGVTRIVFKGSDGKTLTFPLKLQGWPDGGPIVDTPDSIPGLQTYSPALRIS